jgi:hypothetical protein
MQGVFINSRATMLSALQCTTNSYYTMQAYYKDTTPNFYILWVYHSEGDAPFCLSRFELTYPRGASKLYHSVKAITFLSYS